VIGLKNTAIKLNQKQPIETEAEIETIPSAPVMIV